MNDFKSPTLSEDAATLDAVIRDLADQVRAMHEELMAKLAAKDGRIQHLEGRVGTLMTRIDELTNEVARLERELDLSDAREASRR